jgi:hypothetical protein
MLHFVRFFFHATSWFHKYIKGMRWLLASRSTRPQRCGRILWNDTNTPRHEKAANDRGAPHNKGRANETTENKISKMWRGDCEPHLRGPVSPLACLSFCDRAALRHPLGAAATRPSHLKFFNFAIKECTQRNRRDRSQTRMSTP